MATPAAPDAIPVKETKAQKTERLKLAKNPWEAFDEIRQFATGWPRLCSRGVGALLPLVGRLLAGRRPGPGRRQGRRRKSHRVLHDAHRASPTACSPATSSASSAGSPRSTPATSPTSPRARTFSSTGSPSPTSIDVVDVLTQIGLSPKGACGDVVRNVTGCPLAGFNHDELIDASPLALRGLPSSSAPTLSFYNLPRKFKISVTGCPLWCNYPGGQRRRPHRHQARRRRQGRGWLHPARRRRPLHRAVSRNTRPRLRPSGSGLRGRQGRRRNLPRCRCPSRKPHARALQVSLHALRLDPRVLP